MFTLYSMQRSGNSYKARLALAQLAHCPIGWSRSTSSRAKATRPIFWPRIRTARCRCWKSRPAASSPNPTPSCGTSPAARRSRPTTASTAPKRCNGCSSSSTASSPISARRISGSRWSRAGASLQRHALEDWMEEGYRALGVMEKHLTLNDFFAAGRYTIADIALYAYTHVANQCDYDLTTFPAIRAWLSRVAAPAAPRGDDIQSRRRRPHRALTVSKRATSAGRAKNPPPI